MKADIAATLLLPICSVSMIDNNVLIPRAGVLAVHPSPSAAPSAAIVAGATTAAAALSLVDWRGLRASVSATWGGRGRHRA